MSLARTSQIFQNLRLDLLLDDWTDDIWSSDLTDSNTTWPDEFQTALENENYLVAPLTKTVDDLTFWTQQETDVVHQRFWADLNSCEVNIRGLTAMVFCFVSNCDKKTECGPQRESALLAARLYVSMLRIPGSSAFKVFHSLVFEKCLELLNYSQWHFQVINRTQRKRGRQAGMTNKQKVQCVDDRSSQNLVSQESSAWNYETLHCQTSTLEMRRIQMLQCHLLEDIVLLLSETSLQDNTQTVHKLIEIFVSLTQSENSIHPDFAVSSGNMWSPCQLAFAGLDSLSQSRHGSTAQSLITIFRSLLPNLLLMHRGRLVTSSVTIPHSLLEVKDKTAEFVCHVVQAHAGDEGVQTATRTLLQQMCIRVADRAEYRLKVTQAVCHIMKQIPVDCFCGLVSWICKLAKTSQVSNRMMALYVIVGLATGECLTRNDEILRSSLTASEKETVTSAHLITVLLDRCSDCSSSVRSKALSSVGLCATHDTLRQKLHNLLYQKGLSSDIEDTLASHRASVVLPMLVRRTKDQKLFVRRAALQALEAVLLLDISSVTEDMLAVFCHRSMDPGLSVRKQALSSITSLLMVLPDNKKLQSLWLDAVLPVVVDCETTAQEKCLDLMENMIMKKVIGAKKLSDVEHQLAWNLLNIVASDDGWQLRRYFQRACIAWGRQKKLGNDFVNAVIAHGEDEKLDMAGVWLILSCIAPYCSNISVEFVLNSYYHFESQSTKSSIQSQIVNVMGHLTRQLGEYRMEKLGTELSSLLREMKASPELVCSILTCLTKFSEELAASKKGSRSQLSSWVGPVLSLCADYIKQVVMGEVQLHDDGDEEFSRYLYVLGEAAQRCPELLANDVGVMVQSLIVGMPVNGSSAGIVLSGKCRAHAFIVLGKLCLQNRELAKESIVLLARELEENSDPVVRNNVMVVMSDLCVRYTSLVDQYVSNMTLCLQDSEPFVRRQTLILLTNLLQEDYVKWRGSLFFHFLTSLVDQDKDIRLFAKFCLVRLLHSRHPEMFFHHFVECVFHLNDYNSHPAYNKFVQSEKEKKVFSLRGNQRKSDRMEIYAFLLENVTDEQRFRITARLCQDVLGGVIDDLIPLNEHSSEVIADTLTVLCSSEIKLTTLRAKSTADEEQDVIEDNPAAATALAKAKTKVVSQLVKKTVMENIVPIIIALKQILETAHSCLLRELMAYLQELLKDYKDELHDIMSADRQLASEIEFDLRRFEAERKEAKRALELSSRAGFSPAQMVSPGTPRAMGNLLRTPKSSIAPQLRKDAIRSSCFGKMQSPGVVGGSPALGSHRKSTQFTSAGKGENAEIHQLHEGAGLTIEKHTSEGASQEQSGHPAVVNRATSTPQGDLTSISFRALARPSMALPPSPIDHRQSILFMDYPKDTHPNPVWKVKHSKTVATDGRHGK